MERVGGIDLDENDLWQRRWWAVQRVGWVAMVLIVGAALAGAFGRGALARADATDDSGAFTVIWDRVVRHDAPTELLVRLTPEATHDGQARLWLDEALLEEVDVEWVRPEPLAVTSTDGRLIYDLAVAGPATVTLQLRPQGLFHRGGRIGVGSSAGVPITSFVLP